MLSPFIIDDQALTLYRFPENQVTRSLQAWDATDEYIINYLNDNHSDTVFNHALVFNDSFGALSLSVRCKKVTSVSDSKVSHLGLKANAELNDRPLENIQLLDSLTELPSDTDLVLYKIPKSKSLMLEQLRQIRRFCSESTLVVGGDKAKNITSAMLADIEKLLGTTKTSLAVKKSRLFFSELNAVQQEQPFNQVKSWQAEPINATLFNYANVFARERLDIGARFFLQHLPKLSPEQSVIDLGCGNGVLSNCLTTATKQHKPYLC